MEISAQDVRRLRHQMGWSLAEMARQLNTDLATVASWEAGNAAPADEFRYQLVNIMNQADSHMERVQRRPIAEVAMKERGLCQIHNFDLPESEDHTAASAPVATAQSSAQTATKTSTQTPARTPTHKGH